MKRNEDSIAPNLGFGQDLAKDAAYSLPSLSLLMSDMKRQPQWRNEAQMAADYYDGKQLRHKVLAKMKERGQPVIIHNLIGPTVDGVLGMEAKTRTDWVLISNNKESDEAAEAMNEELNTEMRLNGGADECGIAFAAQVKSGLGWVEVRRNPDPFDDSRYQINYIHRNEIYWDWHSKKEDLSDARWLARRRWVDKDVAKRFIKGRDDLIDMVFSRWEGFEGMNDVRVVTPDLTTAFEEYADFTIEDQEWLNTERRQVLMHEVYYRVWEDQAIMLFPDGRVVAYDEDNMLHSAAIMANKCTIEVRPIPKMRVSWFIGPHRIADNESSHPHNLFPYIPFWGLREDGSNMPYGLVRRMIPAQDEINFRRSKMTWILNVKRVIMDDDATNMTHAEVQEQVERDDGIVVLNPDRANTNADAFRVEQDFNIAAQQFQILQEAQKLLQDTAGVYSSFLGQEGGAQSGVAINSLIEQGSTTLATILDNYRNGKRLVGELVLAYLIEDSKEENLEVRIAGGEGKKKKTVILNGPDVNDYGFKEITNDVSRMKAQVLLADIQSTPGYKAQLADRLFNVLQSLPEAVAPVLTPILLEMMDVPNKTEVIKSVKQALGMPDSPEDMSEEERAQLEQEQAAAQEQAELEKQAQELTMEKLSAEIDDIKANAASKERGTLSQDVDDEHTIAQTEKLRQDMKKVIAEVQQMKATFAQEAEQRATDENTAQGAMRMGIDQVKNSMRAKPEQGQQA